MNLLNRNGQTENSDAIERDGGIIKLGSIQFIDSEMAELRMRYQVRMKRDSRDLDPRHEMHALHVIKMDDQQADLLD